MGQYSTEASSKGANLLLALTYVARVISSNGSSTRSTQCRRIATRYDKLEANYLAFVKRAAIRVWLRAYELAP